MVIVYGITAVGPLKHLNGEKQHLHRRVFVDRRKAEEAIPAFLEACCNSPDGDPRSLTDLDEQSAKAHILELELVED